MSSPLSSGPRTIPSPDGTRIGALEYVPPTPARSGSPILFVSALGVPVGYYSRLLSASAGSGRQIVASELRGMPYGTASGSAYLICT